jgi:putative glutamine amidotransferase
VARTGAQDRSGGETRLQQAFATLSGVSGPRIGITSETIEHDGRAISASNRVYVDAVLEAGGLPIVLPVVPGESAADMLEGLDGLLLSGGGDIEPARYGQRTTAELDGVDPARDAFELPLVCSALERRLPILGVCRGHQVLNVALGGSLEQHVGLGHREKGRPADVIHHVDVAPHSLLGAVLGTRSIGVNTLHHQAVVEAGAGLQVVARSDDGLIEGVEGVGDLRVLGVQWHPELLVHLPEHLALFRWLVAEAATAPATRPTRRIPVAPVRGRARRAVA